MALQENAAALVAGTLEAVSVAAFVCDFEGRVTAMSSMAEALIADDGRLKLREGRLVARGEADTRALAAMVYAAAVSAPSTTPPTPTLVLHDLIGGDPLLVEVAPIPGDRGLGVAALVIARSGRGSHDRVARLARALFDLTPTESQVVAALVAGRSPVVIAQAMGISLGTVRTHIRHVFQKVRVRSVVELVAAITSRL